MGALRLLVAAIASGLVNALPEPTTALRLEERHIDCSKVTGALSVLKRLGPPATTFCSSYLKISGAQTTKTTTTPAVVTVTTSTTTVTVTSPSCAIAKRDVAFDYKDIEYTTVEGLEKRTNILPLLAAFAAAKVSEGCSCLALQPKATTTLVLTAPAPTTKIVATLTKCVADTACKPNGFGNTCTQNSQCCSGTCGSTFDSTICCNPVGQYCDLSRPDGCCSGTCLNTGDLNDLDGTCI